MKYKITPRLLVQEKIKRCCLDDCKAACCLHGVWIDAQKKKVILDHQNIIREHMRPDFADSSLWFDGRIEEDPFTPSELVYHSTVIKDENHYGDTACVFLREDSKCALQTASQAAGFHPWKLKPFYCILHPLDLNKNGQITLDDTDLLLEEKGSCLRRADKEIPLLITFEPELRYFLGDKKFNNLLKITGIKK
jgi:hypothetical protein